MGGGSSPFEVEDISSGEQLECPDCGRKFNPIPYEKHVKICAKVFLQKSKAFDSKKMRIADNPELLKIQQAALRSEKKATAAAAAASKKKSDAAAASRRAEERAVGGTGGGNGGKWKEQSNQFREAMRMARMVAKAEKTGGPMPEMAPSAPDPSLVPCPNCGRTFNERAAERHIPQCKNIRAQPKSLKRGSGGAGGRAGTGAVNKAKQQTSGAGRW
ncbi:ZC2HC1A [Symbiodinium microadriaticum]|nr:ZC2HC1A [Symbiodinium microadriaticum]